MSVRCDAPEPRPMRNIFSTIRFARCPCELIRPRLLVRSEVISATNDFCSSPSSTPSSSSTSCNSVRSSTETSEKLLTKFSGLRISWATPAVSSPRPASFSRITIWSCALCSAPSVLSSSTFLPCSSVASCSTRFRRCTSSACRRNTSSAAAISATSSCPSISTLVSRSPPAILSIQFESMLRRRSRILPR